MKPKENKEWDGFEKLFDGLIKVSHSEIKAKLDEEKKAKVGKKRKKKESGNAK